MKNLLLSVVGAGGLLSLSSVLAPEGKDGKWVRFLFSLVAFLLLASTLRVTGLPLPATDPPAQGETFSGDSESYVWELSLSLLRSSLAREMDLPVGEITLRADRSANPPTLNVTLPEGADPSRARAFLAGELSKDWTVTVVCR